MDSWAVSGCFAMWWLMRISRTIRKSSNYEAEKNRCEFVFEKALQVVLATGVDYMIPIKDMTACNVKEDSRYSTTPPTSADNYIM